MVGAVAQLLLLVFGAALVKPVYRVHDYVVGHIIFSVLFTLASLQVPSTIQTWLLYHNALSSDVVVEDILKYSRIKEGREDGGEDDALGQVQELRKLLAKQEQAIERLQRGKGGAGGEERGGGGLTAEHRNESTDAIAALVSSEWRSGGGERNCASERGGRGHPLTRLARSGTSVGEDLANARTKVDHGFTSMSNLNVWGGMSGVSEEGEGRGSDASTGVGGMGGSGGGGSAGSMGSGSAASGSAASVAADDFRFAQPDALPPR